MKKRTKNSKGFTLAELLVVITIIGLISLVVFPSVSLVLEQNKKDRYKYHEKILTEAAKVFIDKEKDDIDDLAGFPGCLILTYDDLKGVNLLKDFDDETATCSVNAKVKVQRVSENKYQYTPYVKCTNNSDNKILFESNTTEDFNSCNAYGS